MENIQVALSFLYSETYVKINELVVRFQRDQSAAAVPDGLTWCPSLDAKISADI